MLQHTKTFLSIMSFQFCGNSLGETLSCSSMTVFNVEEIQWPAQSPDLKPTENFWDGLERRVRPSHPISVPDLTNAFFV